MLFHSLLRAEIVLNPIWDPNCIFRSFGSNFRHFHQYHLIPYIESTLNLIEKLFQEIILFDINSTFFEN